MPPPPRPAPRAPAPAPRPPPPPPRTGGKRGAGLNEERDQTLNQLLTELDGFEGRPGVLLLAATNRPEVLDPALLRPGRLSRRVVVPLPDVEGRGDILGVHMRGVPMAGGARERGEAAEAIARITAGGAGGGQSGRGAPEGGGRTCGVLLGRLRLAS